MIKFLINFLNYVKTAIILCYEYGYGNIIEPLLKQDEIKNDTE